MRFAAAGRGRRKRRSAFDYLVAGAFLAAIAVLAAAFAVVSSDTTRGTAQASDGDSLRIGAARIRLVGIDAPELGQSCTAAGITSNCGLAARDHLRGLIEGREVECIGWERDRYDRLLARCLSAGVELNQRMVLDGWAIAYGDYTTEEEIARRERRGVWAGDFQTPRDWRRQHADAADDGGYAGLLSRMAGRLVAGLVRWLEM